MNSNIFWLNHIHALWIGDAYDRSFADCTVRGSLVKTWFELVLYINPYKESKFSPGNGSKWNKHDDQNSQWPRDFSKSYSIPSSVTQILSVCNFEKFKGIKFILALLVLIIVPLVWYCVCNRSEARNVVVQPMAPQTFPNVYPQFNPQMFHQNTGSGQNLLQLLQLL